jgi:hypothetical protein
MFRLYFYPVADSFLLVILAALVLTGLLLLRPAQSRLSWRRRAALAVARAAVIALVILAMLRPTLVYTETKKEKATLIILADATRSMSVPDEAPTGRTRWEALRNAVAEAAPALRELLRDFEVKVYAFDEELHPLEITADGKIALPEKPEGRQTAIGAAISDALRRETGKRLLGVILLSDGAQRALAPRDLPPQDAAAALKHQGDPLFTVVFGQSRGLGAARDVAVKELLAPATVFVKNELTVTGQIRIDGYVDRDIPVRLWFETAPGKMEIVGQEIVKAVADGQVIPVKFKYAPQTCGECKLTLAADPQLDELVTTNNELSTFVHVLKGGLNVLYIEGTYRPEQKWIRWALESSRDIHVDCVRLDARRPETRPGDLAACFRPGKYEVYILGDVDSTAFHESELRDLAETVSGGAGLLMLGGLHSFGPGRYSETPLADVLPVMMDRLDRQNFDEPTRDDLHWPGPLQMMPTDFGRRHFALMLAGDEKESLEVWSKLPPLKGANQFLRLAPGAKVLADAGEGKPLLVAQNFGAGRVLAFAGDSTWLWWMHGFEAAHKRFWRQIVLWLARKDQAQEGNVWVRMEKRRFAPGQRVEFTAGAQASNGELVKDADYKAEIVLPDGTHAPVALVHQGEQMSGSFRQTQAAGDYALEVTATAKERPLGTARARFTVFAQDLELDDASADAATMESLAAMTDGQRLAPEQLPELIQRLAHQTKNLEIQQETKKTFWDKWPFFLALVGLLTVEWYLRKRWGLV